MPMVSADLQPVHIQTYIKTTMSDSNTSNKEELLKPVPNPESLPTREQDEAMEKPNSTREPPKDNEEPESLTKIEAFLLVVSICVSSRRYTISTVGG